MTLDKTSAVARGGDIESNDHEGSSQRRKRGVEDGLMILDKSQSAAKGFDVLPYFGGYFDCVREPRDVAGPNSGEQGEPARGKGVKQEAGDLSRDRGSPRAAGTVVHSPGEGTEVARGAAIVS